MDDRELLREYVQSGSEHAFAELVARHLNLVYATARRVAGDASVAEDVAQTVFIRLARKAWLIHDGQALVSWLYRAAYRTALDAIRGESRRRQRETEAMNLAEQNAAPPAAWDNLAPLLDAAMQSLGREERNALLLRYFEGRTMRETGDALGVSAPAAQMRVNRAVEKLRTYFARAGITVAAGELAGLLDARASELAPAELAARVQAASLGAGVGGLGFWGGILFMSTKIKIALLVVVLAAVVISWFAFYLNPRTTKAPTPANHALADLPKAPAPPAAMPAPAKIAEAKEPAVPGVMAEKPAEAVAETPEAPKPDPRLNLATAIPEMIRLLEARDFDEFLDKFLSDDQKREMAEHQMTVKQLAEMARNLPGDGESITALIRDLKIIQGQTPTYANGSTKATFSLSKNQAGDPGYLIFNYVDGLWYFELR